MRINYTIEIACKAEKVFSWIDEPEKAMRWQKGVKNGEIIKETPQRIGTTFKEEMEENGKSLIMFGEITNYIPQILISFHLESKIHQVEVKYEVSGDQKKSKVSMESIINWKFPMNVISLFIGQKIKDKIYKQTESEFCELKRLCENEPNNEITEVCPNK